jgi:hypothetical protein
MRAERDYTIIEESQLKKLASDEEIAADGFKGQDGRSVEDSVSC